MGDRLVAPADEVIIEVATATPEPKVNLDCDSDAEKSFEDYERWTKVNSAPLISEGNAKKGKAVYVDI